MRFWGPHIKISGEWIMTSPNDDNLSANQKRAADDFEKQAQESTDQATRARISVRRTPGLGRSLITAPIRPNTHGLGRPPLI